LWMNPMHHEAVGSARLYLFQELSTLGQGQKLEGVKRALDKLSTKPFFWAISRR
jgi:hypothetical protein